MSSDKDKEVDFLRLPNITPHQVVSLLLNRYPTVRDLVCSDEYCFEEPTRVYDAFAKVVIERSYDPDFIQSVARFIDELAESDNLLIESVLSASLLEGIAENEQLARTISRSISPRSKRVLQEVESKIYGRSPSAEET